MKEIITLQFGGLANYTGAHFWNLQDEALGRAAAGGGPGDGVDERALFAWSEDRHGAPTYHPRAVMLDVGGATGGVSFSRDAAAAAAALAAGGGGSTGGGAWAGGVELHAAAPVPKSAFAEELERQARVDFGAAPAAEIERCQAALEAAVRRLDIGGGGGSGSGGAAATATAAASGVRFWSDFLKADLHPRSVLALPGAWAGGPPLEGYGAASALAHGPGAAVEAAVDAARWWAEQCDGLQGLQVFADDAASAFGGIARDALDALEAELPGARVVFFSLRPTVDASGGGAGGGGGGGGGVSVSRALGEALAAAELSERSAVYVPLSLPAAAPAALPLLRWPAGWERSEYVTGALLAAAVDTLTLPFRLAGGGGSGAGSPAIGTADLHSWAQLLCGRGGGSGANLAAAAMQLPAGAVETDEWRAAAAGDARQRQRQPAANGASDARDNGDGSGNDGGSDDDGEEGPRWLSTCSRRVLQLSLNGSSGAQRRRGAPSPSAGAEPPLAPSASLAESVVLRGARAPDGGQVRGGAAAAAAGLDAALGREPRRRCVVHRCVAAAPVAVPLPFPALFGPRVGEHGEVVARWGGSTAAGAAAAGARDGRHVASCPVLTRVAATSEFGPWLEARADSLSGGAARTAAGAALASTWGYARGDLDEACERLRTMAASYAEDD